MSPRKPKFRKGQAVTPKQGLRLEGQKGFVVGYSDSPYWQHKGTPVEVQFDQGPPPQGFKPMGVFTEWRRYASLFYGEEELLPWHS